MYFFFSVVCLSPAFCEEKSKNILKQTQAVMTLVLAYSLEMQRGEQFDILSVIEYFTRRISELAVVHALTLCPFLYLHNDCLISGITVHCFLLNSKNCILGCDRSFWRFLSLSSLSREFDICYILISDSNEIK